jgi:hypothetical protein
MNLKILEKSNNLLHFVTRSYTVINEYLRILKITLDLFDKKEDYEVTNGSLRRTRSVSSRPLSLIIKEPRTNLSHWFKLELDNNHMRATFIPSQRGQMEWMHSQLERNKIVQKSIEEYSKEYYLYLQKKKAKTKLFLCPKT